MAAQNVEYVELYVTDEWLATEYFVSSFGFTRVAESSDHGRHSVLLRQGTAQVIVSAGPQAGEFLDAHGDGVADIAFGCDDAGETFGRAVAAGASPVSSGPGLPVVSGGFGDVRHTLLTRTAGGCLPAGRSWVPVPAAPASATDRVHALDHVAVCVNGGTLAAVADFYTDGFGLARYSSEYTEVGDQAMDSVVVRSAAGGITFTLLEPDLAKSPGQLDSFLTRNGGPGVQHLAFGVDDIIAAVHQFTGRGIGFLRTPGTYYDMLAGRLPGIQAEIAGLREANVLADSDEFGYLLQIFSRSPYERNTLFYELVQRRGARGFGGANIRALYEAVERERLAAQ
jgi:4-hydroxymandelate synthase